jgi:hypothetical protein
LKYEVCLAVSITLIVLWDVTPLFAEMGTQHFREVGGKHPPELKGVTSPENYYLI